MREVKQEWCEEFIKKRFSARHHAFAGDPDAGIAIWLFWEDAHKAGLWEPGVYGGPMSKALAKLTEIKEVRNNDEELLFDAFRLKREVYEQISTGAVR